jgi:hypothetical protein
LGRVFSPSNNATKYLILENLILICTNLSRNILYTDQKIYVIGGSKMIKILSIVIIGFFFINGLNSIVLGCTGFTASDSSNVLVGNNEDLSLLADPQLRIIPPSGNNYGRVVFYCKWPYPFNSGTYSAFGGMNDQGLFFDIYSTPNLVPTNPSDKPTYNQDIFAYCIRTCATVDEVVDVFNTYYVPYMDDIQGFFVDRTGNSVIIEGDEVIFKQGNYQVVTNYLQTHPELGWYPCWRYDTAESMLEDMDDLSVDYFKEICEAVHVERVALPDYILDTVYSNICDLNNGIMYYNFFHDYNNFLEIHIPEIFEQGYQNYDLPSLFVDNTSHRPNKPETLTGEVSGRVNREYEYSTTGFDDDGDILFYLFDWGDETDSGWIGYYDSGEPCLAYHTWAEVGNYEVRVKTKDLFCYESDWSDPLVVTMPKNKVIEIFNPWLFRLIHRSPILEFIL